jgi:hypothetical protein
MLRIASVFSLLILICGCVAESNAPQRIAVPELPIRDNFQIEAGDFINDSLLPIFPNPFNRAAGDTHLNLHFQLSDSSQVLILIQNPMGEEVVRFKDSTLSKGQYRAQWAPLNSAREPLNAGLYFVTFRTRRYISSRMLSIQTN